MEDSFKVEKHPTDFDIRLIVVSVVFLNRSTADNVIASVHSYVARTHGLTLYEGQEFQCTPISSCEPKSLVLENHYMPRETDGEARRDSPVWNV